MFPLAVAPPLRVVNPDTVNAPPRDESPDPTVKVLVPVTLVAPLRFTIPVPLEKVPAPVWE